MARSMIAVLLLAAELLAQNAPVPANPFDAAINEWGAHPPAGFSLRLERTGGAVRQEGELLTVRISYETPYPRQFPGPPQSEFYQFAGFLIDPPPQNCGTLAQPCRDSVAEMAHRNDPLFNFETRTSNVETDLNTFIPHLAPGSYRVAVIMIKQVLKSGDFRSNTYGYTDPREYLVSNATAFEVRPADDAWVIRTVMASRALLVAPRREEDFEPRQREARALGSINRPQAYQAALEIVGSSLDPQVNVDLMHSLARDISPQQVCNLMRSRLKAPEQRANMEYAKYMAQFCADAAFPFPEELKTAGSGDPRWRDWSERRSAEQENVQWEVMAVAAGTGLKDAAARQSRLEVVKYGAQLLTRGGSPGDLRPAILQTAQRVVSELPGYPAPEIVTILAQQWPLLKLAGPAPALRKIIANLAGNRDESPSGYQPFPWVLARRAAIRRLAELNPGEGRAVLLDELAHFRSTLDQFLTELLPPDSVPPMDDALLDYYASTRNGQRQAGASAATLIARYLSPAAADRLKAMIQSRRDPCQAELLSYFLRAQPATAESILKRTPWDLHKPVDICWEPWIAGVPPLLMRPLMEDYLIFHLQHEAPNVKWMAARKLSDFGTVRARKRLEDAYQYFHDYWKGREAELASPGYRDGAMLESALRNAIARGKAWLTDEAALRKLTDACMTALCRQGGLTDAGQWEPTLRIEITPGRDGYGWDGRMAQYYGLQGLPEIEQKLAQFPKGTEFSVWVLASRPDQDEINSELRPFAEQHELILK